MEQKSSAIDSKSLKYANNPFIKQNTPKTSSVSKNKKKKVPSKATTNNSTNKKMHGKTHSNKYRDDTYKSQKNQSIRKKTKNKKRNNNYKNKLAADNKKQPTNKSLTNIDQQTMKFGENPFLQTNGKKRSKTLPYPSDSEANFALPIIDFDSTTKSVPINIVKSISSLSSNNLSVAMSEKPKKPKKKTSFKFLHSISTRMLPSKNGQSFEKKKKRRLSFFSKKRRNSDPQTSTPISATSSQQITKFPHYKPAKPPETTLQESKSNHDHQQGQQHQSRVRRNSDSAVSNHEYVIFKDKPLPPKPVKKTKKHKNKKKTITVEDNLRMISSLLRFDKSAWNFENDHVDIYHKQCTNIEYETFVPSLKDLRYPTMLSSVTLPKLCHSKQYSVSVKYDIKTFISKQPLPKMDDIKDNENNPIINCLKLDFSAKTTIQIAISELTHKLKKKYKQYVSYISSLHSSCFLLKVCGREQYLSMKNKLNNNKIISLSYIRNCIRQNKIHNMELILLYDDTFKMFNDSFVRKSLRESYKKYRQTYDKKALLYEDKGYSCIANTLHHTINSKSSLTQDLKRLHEDINNEVVWLQKQMHKADISAVLLSKCERPIEFNISSLKNMTTCPRYYAQPDKYYLCVLRIELMFGGQTFEQCSWDIVMPTQSISKNIKMPSQHCTFSTKQTGLKYASLPREAVWCFTLYGIEKNDAELQKKRKKKEAQILQFDEEKNAKNTDELTGISTRMVQDDVDGLIDGINDNVYSSEPIAWCKLPLIDHEHCVNKGTYYLHLWTVPIYNKVKGGPKIDPYSTGVWKKFGTVRECDLSKQNESNRIILTINFLFKKYPYRDIVAPIVNPRRPQHISSKIRACKKRDSSVSDILSNIIERDGIFPLNGRDKMLIYANKKKLMKNCECIATFLRSVNWLDISARMEAYDYLEKWCGPTRNYEDMIELLRYEFADNRIRLYAILCLNKLDDYTLQRKCLLQLVQALKNETHHASFLSRFLMMRALNNPFQIGHYLFWHLKSEYHGDNLYNLQYNERYGLLLEEYLLYIPYYAPYPKVNVIKQLHKETQLINELKFISFAMKNAKNAKKKWNKQDLKNLLQQELMRLNQQFFNTNDTMILPLNPSYNVGNIEFEKCRFMSSAKVPLWLVFSNADPFCCDSIEIMFKCGDDLRQDILTSQLISVMDSFWLNANIDLKMKTYEVIVTGSMSGMLELILNSKTINDIGISTTSHLKYICNNNSDSDSDLDLKLEEKKENYSRSVAGYCVATWTLGIGDRHPDNIMIHQNGALFHIDFGHFLGNFKEKDIGGLLTWKRERTPFVFTNCMKYCIQGGDAQNKQQKKLYAQFVRWLFVAYSEIRKRYKFLLSLLLLMLPSQLPELITESDVEFFTQILRLDLYDNQSIASHIENTLKFCLSDKTKKFDDMMHKIHHL